MKAIYIHKDGQQLGPFTEKQIQGRLFSEELSRTDLAWHEGLDSWMALSAIISVPPLMPFMEALPDSSEQPSAEESPDLYGGFWFAKRLYIQIPDDKGDGEESARLPMKSMAKHMMDLTNDLPGVRKWIDRNYDKETIDTEEKRWKFLQELLLILIGNGKNLLWRGVLFTSLTEEEVKSQLISMPEIAEGLNWDKGSTVVIQTCPDLENTPVLWGKLISGKRKSKMDPSMDLTSLGEM